MKLLIVLDIDDTLIRSGELQKEYIENNLHKLPEKLRGIMIEERLKKGKSIGEIIRNLSSEEAKVIVEFYEKWFDWAVERKLRLTFPDTLKALDELSKLGKLAIVSKQTGYDQRRKLILSGLSKYFDAEDVLIVYENEDKASALRKLKEKYPNYLIVYVGDRPEDVEAAKKANVIAVRILQGRYSNKPSKVKADYKIESLSELPRILQNLLNNFS